MLVFLGVSLTFTRKVFGANDNAARKIRNLKAVQSGQIPAAARFCVEVLRCIVAFEDDDGGVREDAAPAQ